MYAIPCYTFIIQYVIDRCWLNRRRWLDHLPGNPLARASIARREPQGQEPVAPARWEPSNGQWIDREGRQPPKGIAVTPDDRWAVPVVFGNDLESRAIAEAFAVDHNNLTMVGCEFSVGDIAKLWESVRVSLKNGQQFTVAVVYEKPKTNVHGRP